MHNRSGTQKLAPDGWPAAPQVPALDLLSDRLRQQIVWALAHEPRTPTALVHALSSSQPRISKHLRILHAAGLVESHQDPRDHRARVYDIRPEQFTILNGWLDDIQRNWQRCHTTAADPDYYKKRNPLNQALTTRGTPRKRIPRALKDPWER